MSLAIPVYHRIISGKQYIDENFHEDIDLELIAKNAYISRFHFHRLFTRIYRKTPHQYLTRKRLDKAKELLSHEDATVSGVCNQVGFESIGSFSILFKKEIGYPPQAYRNIAWLKQQEKKEEPRKFIPHCFIESYWLDKEY